MEQNTTPESGFKIVNLLLLESNFKRESTVTFEQDKITNSVIVDVNVQIVNETVFVTETLKYEQKVADQLEVSAEIKMVGVFEKTGESQLDLQQFGNVNGAAIIFPYIREQLSNLSAKAGIGLVILPPFNFTKSSVVD